MTAWIELLLRHRALVLLISAGLLILAAWQAAGVKTDNSLERLMPENDPQMTILRQVYEQFGSSEITLVAWQTDALFSNEEIAKIRELTARFEDLPEVQWVTSLTNTTSVSDIDDALVVEPLIAADRATFTAAELAAIRERALADTLLHDALLSPDGRTTAITLGLERLDDVNPEFRIEFAKKIEDILDEFGGHTNYWLAGTAPIQKIYNASIKHDMLVFYPVTIALLALALFFAFPFISGVLTPFLAMASLSILTMGAYALAGNTINVVTTMLPPLIMVITTSAMVHLIAHCRRIEGGDPRRAVVHAAALVALPVLLNVLTDMVGFGSLTISRVLPVRNFGIFSVVGLALIFLFTVTVAPVLLSYRPPPPLTLPTGRASRSDRLIRHIIRGCEVASLGHRRLIIIFSLAVFGLAGYGISRIVVETNLMDHFDEQSRIRRDLQAIQEHLTGVMSLDLILETAEDDGALDAETIRYADEVMHDFAAQEIMLSAQSLSSVLRRIHRLYTREDGLPPSTEANVQYFDFFLGGAGRLIEQYIDPSRRTLRIAGRHRYVSSRQSMELGKWVEARLAQDRPAGVKRAYLSGLTPVYNNMVHNIVSGQLWGFSLALMLIAVIMVLMQRSLKLGLLVMIPNVLPVALTAGVMGLAGISLNTATAMIASIAIGLAVDDTIHFTTFYRRYRRENLTPEDAIRRVLHEVGPAMITTSLVLFIGFFVLVFSDFGPMRMFGLLSSLAIFSALLGDLLVLPALLPLVDRRGKMARLWAKR